MPKSRVEFWKEKFEANVARDRRNVEKLLERGWRVAIVWECASKTKNEETLSARLDDLVNWLKSGSGYFELP
ncbi:hypothetical protein HCR_23290 (plasmid) [Hydrogenimonas cancrithermarum]|uniref:DNA mismatch endonuclease Vsr n=1 Tax=Hydrogenimonas cancrithermarum TaxID=2993563 RepID=A0ABM8FNN9_9BACT|nr:hypothetical protein HCR_23290 [Hydrogenimonas cancrithermarum]